MATGGHKVPKDIPSSQRKCVVDPDTSSDNEEQFLDAAGTPNEVQQLKLENEELRRILDSIKKCRLVAVEKYSTEKLNLLYRDFTKMVVAPASGDVIVFGCKEGEDPAFFIYKVGSLEYLKKVDASCKHYGNTNLLAINLEDKDKVLISCWSCRNIKMLDLETEMYETAFGVQDYYPTIMCQAENGDVYVLHKPYLGRETLLVLNRHGSTLNLTKNPMNVDTASGHEKGMVFLPLPLNCVVISSYSTKRPPLDHVRAISCDSGVTKWNFINDADSSGLDRSTLIDPLIHAYTFPIKTILSMTRPRSNACGNDITYSSAHQTLLVGSKDKILVHHPENGFHLQTIHLQDFGSVWDMAIHGSQLILHHVHENQHKISYLKFLSV